MAIDREAALALELPAHEVEVERGALRFFAQVTGERRAEYVDVFDRFAGHDVCNDGSWFNGPMLPKVYMLHPTAEGQAAMARAVAEQLERTPPGAGFSGP